MITLYLDWHEVLWWMQGGMAGSHLRWNVYEDMVNRVWPQADEQERRNMWLIMRRDLGDYWRPNGWNSYETCPHGEGPWKPAAGVLTYSDDKRYDPAKVITDLTPWRYFRQVLARFDPENQFAVTMAVHNTEELDAVLRLMPAATIIKQPNLSHFKRGEKWQSDTATITVRAYRWDNEYRIDWTRRCAEDKITKVEQIIITDEGGRCNIQT